MAVTRPLSLEVTQSSGWPPLLPMTMLPAVPSIPRSRRVPAAASCAGGGAGVVRTVGGGAGVVVVSSVAAVVAMAAVVDGGSVVAIVTRTGSSGGTIGAPRLVSLTALTRLVSPPPEERTTAAMLAAATRPTPAAMIPQPPRPSCRPAQVHRQHERCAGFDDVRFEVGSVGRPGLRLDADRVVGRVEHPVVDGRAANQGW